MAQLNLWQALNLCLEQAVQKDKSIILMGREFGLDNKNLRNTEQLQEKFGHARILHLHVGEAGLLGVATGLAIKGFKPIVELPQTGFQFKALHNIKEIIARYRQATQGKIIVPLIIRVPFLPGQSPESIFTQIPGLKVVAVNSARRAKGLLHSAMKEKNPIIVLEPTSLYQSDVEEVPTEEYTTPLKAKVLREGKDVTMISWGEGVPLALQAAKEIAIEGIETEVIDVQSLVPLDVQTILTSIKKTSRIVIIQTNPLHSGFANELIARLQKEAILHLEAPISTVASFDLPDKNPLFTPFSFPSTTRIKNEVKKTLRF